MVTIESAARNIMGQDVTRKRPQQDINGSGQREFNYGSLSSSVVNVLLIKHYLNNDQTSKEGLKQLFPAKLVGDISLDIKDFDLIVTATEIFQVVNAQIKANNITGLLTTDPGYFYCDLTYFDHDTVIEN